MKTREETKRYLNNALNELSDPGAVGHYMRCNRYASMLEEAFGVKGPVELTEAIFDLLDQMPEGFTWATSKDGRPVALGSRVWLGDREMRVVAVSHRGRIAIREWTKERGRGAFWVPADKVTVEEPDTQERTCKAVGEDPLGFRLCSSCGYESWADEDSVTPYCPNCGAKVVE